MVDAFAVVHATKMLNLTSPLIVEGSTGTTHVEEAHVVQLCPKELRQTALPSFQSQSVR